MRPLPYPRSASRPGLPSLLVLFGLWGASGCLMQPSFSAKTTTADGVLIEVPLTPEPQVVSDDAMTVKRLVLTPVPLDKEGKTRGLALAIQIGFANGAKPASILIDDVSDEPILSIVNDPHPALNNEHHWNVLTAPHSPMDEYAKWVMTLDNTIRVYRFTVKLADGSTHVLRYPIFIPTRGKAIIRYQLGVTA